MAKAYNHLDSGCVAAIPPMVPSSPLHMPSSSLPETQRCGARRRPRTRAPSPAADLATARGARHQDGGSSAQPSQVHVPLLTEKPVSARCGSAFVCFDIGGECWQKRNLWVWELGSAHHNYDRYVVLVKTPSNCRASCCVWVCWLLYLGPIIVGPRHPHLASRAC